MIRKSFICEDTDLLFIYTAVHDNKIATIIIILKINHYVFFSSFFLYLVFSVVFCSKYHVIV